MRSAFLLVGVLALTAVVNGQSRSLSSSPEVSIRFESATMRADAATGPDSGLRTRNRITMRGVELHLGNSVILADEVEMPVGEGAVGQEEIQLRGNVRLRATLDHSKLDALLLSLAGSPKP